MNNITAAQDSYAQLIEDCRQKRTEYPIPTMVNGRAGTKYVTRNLEIDLTDVPAFFMGTAPDHILPVHQVAAMEAIVERRFHLPYSRSVWFYAVDGNSAALARAPQKYHLPVSRDYAMIVEEDDGIIIMTPFMRHTGHKHWIRQSWSANIIPGPDGAIENYIDPIWLKTESEFQVTMEAAISSRVRLVLIDIHRVMTQRHGHWDAAPAGQHTDRVNARRIKLGLPEVPRMRVIDLSTLLPPPTKTTGTGSPKSPHYRRGTWRTSSKTGIMSPVRASAIHGGGAAAPPWYEVRS